MSILTLLCDNAYKREIYLKMYNLKKKRYNLKVQNLELLQIHYLNTNRITNLFLGCLLCIDLVHETQSTLLWWMTWQVQALC